VDGAGDMAPPGVVVEGAVVEGAVVEGAVVAGAEVEGVEPPAAGAASSFLLHADSETARTEARIRVLVIMSSSPFSGSNA